MKNSRDRAFAVLAPLLLTLAGCGSGGSHKEARATATPVPASVVAGTGTIAPTEGLAGIIAPFENVAIQSSLTEPTDEVYVNEGDRVHAGELLARLNTDDLRAELAADEATVNSNASTTAHTVFAGKLAIAQGVTGLSSAQSAAVQARQTLLKDQTDLARYQDLFKNGYVPAQQVSQQETLVRNDVQAVRAAEAGVSSARDTVVQNGSLSKPGLQSTAVQQAQATVEQARAQANQIRVQIEKAQIYSPIDGVVVNRNLNPGEYPGTRQIFTLQQVDPIYAVLHGSGTQIAPIRTGNAVSVVASDLRTAPFTGRVIGVLNQVTPGSTDFQVKVLLGNPAFRLRPGMAVYGTVHLPERTGVRIPISAFNDVSHTSVTLLDADNKLSVKMVTDEAENAHDAIVSGIAAGTRILRNGQS